MFKFNRLLLVLVVLSYTTISPKTNANNELVSPINGLSLNNKDVAETYSFFVVGHAYGVSGSSLYPAGSLLSKVSKLNHADSKFGVFLGDFLQHTREPATADRELALFKHHVGQEVDVPLFIAPGNHDFRNPEWYADRLGPDYVFFDLGADSFIILNSQRDGACNLGVEQTELVLEKIKRLGKKEQLNSVFVLFHKPLWGVGIPEVEKINPWVNEPMGEECGSFSKNIVPKFAELSTKAPVYFMSGDIGCKDYLSNILHGGIGALESFPVFYQRHSKHDMHFIATGLCANENDNAVQVNVSGKDVSFVVKSLSSRIWPDIETFNIAYWEEFYTRSDRLKANAKSNEALPPRFTVILDKIKSTLLSKKFIAGYFFGLMFAGFTVVIIILFRKRTRNA